MSAMQRKSKSQTKKEIIEFLDQTCGLTDPKSGKHRCGTIHRNCLVLATSYKDKPRATPLEFFHEGLTIYIFGEGSGKIANIKRNHNVSAAIYQQPMKIAMGTSSAMVATTALMDLLGHIQLVETLILPGQSH